MTGCADMKLLMHGLLDGELDAANALTCEEHLAACSRCAAEYEAFQALRQVIRTGDARHRALDALRSRVLAALDAASEAPPGRIDNRRASPSQPSSWRRWAPVASGWRWLRASRSSLQRPYGSRPGQRTRGRARPIAPRGPP